MRHHHQVSKSAETTMSEAVLEGLDHITKTTIAMAETIKNAKTEKEKMEESKKLLDGLFGIALDATHMAENIIELKKQPI